MMPTTLPPTAGRKRAAPESESEKRRALEDAARLDVPVAQQSATSSSAPPPSTTTEIFAPELLASGGALRPVLDQLDVRGVYDICRSSPAFRASCLELERGGYWRDRLQNMLRTPYSCVIYDTSKPTWFGKFVTTALPRYSGGMSRIALYPPLSAFTGTVALAMFRPQCEQCFDVEVERIEMDDDVADSVEAAIVDVAISANVNYSDRSTMYRIRAFPCTRNDVVGFAGAAGRSALLTRSGTIRAGDGASISSTVPFVAIDVATNTRLLGVRADDELHVGSADDSATTLLMPGVAGFACALENVFASDTEGNLWIPNAADGPLKIYDGSAVPVIGVSPVFSLLQDGTLLINEWQQVPPVQRSLVRIRGPEPLAVVRSSRYEQNVQDFVAIGRESGTLYYGSGVRDRFGRTLYGRFDVSAIPHTSRCVDCDIRSGGVISYFAALFVDGRLRIYNAEPGAVWYYGEYNSSLNHQK